MGASISKIINCEHCIECMEHCKNNNRINNTYELIKLPSPPKSCMISKSNSKFKEMKKRKVTFS